MSNSETPETSASSGGSTPVFIRNLEVSESERPTLLVSEETMSKAEKRIEVSLPETLVKRIDEYVKMGFYASIEDAVADMLPIGLDATDSAYKEGKLVKHRKK
jgi:hypothetical protein